MKTVKLHFCDGKGYEMKEFYFPIKDKKYICPMCGFIVEKGKKIKDVLTEVRNELPQKP